MTQDIQTLRNCAAILIGEVKQLEFFALIEVNDLTSVQK
jgi:hypothetical protein